MIKTSFEAKLVVDGNKWGGRIEMIGWTAVLKTEYKSVNNINSEPVI